MRHLIVLLLLLVPADAHLGNENNTEARLYSDSMRLVIRTSILFAWTLLGDNAPALADEAGQAIVRPLLIATAPELISVTAGGKALLPTQVDCVFEVEKDVAFVLNLERPTAWPVVVEAKFFDRLSSLDTGTIHVFDYTASRLSRDLEPIAQAVTDQRSPSLSFSLVAAASPAAASVSVVKPLTEFPTKLVGTSLLLLAAGLIGFLTYRRLRRQGGGDRPHFQRCHLRQWRHPVRRCE